MKSSHIILKNFFCFRVLRFDVDELIGFHVIEMNMYIVD